EALADDAQIVADDRFVSALGGPGSALGTIDGGRDGARRSRSGLGKRIGLSRWVTRKHQDPQIIVMAPARSAAGDGQIMSFASNSLGPWQRRDPPPLGKVCRV